LTGLKKLSILMIVVFGIIMVTVYAESDVLYVSDGGIVIEGSLLRELSAKKGSDVTITVVRSGIDWTNRDVISAGVAESIAYYAEGSLDKDFNYRFEFSLKENGVYNVYIGAEGLSTPLKRELRYINKARNEEAIQLLYTDPDTENVLKTRRYDLGLFDSIFDEADLAATASILKTEMEGKLELKTEEVMQYAQKAMLISIMNQNQENEKDIAQYEKYFYFDGKKFYSSSVSEELTKYVSNKGIKSFSEFDGVLIDGLLLSNIHKNDGMGTVKGILKTYAEKYGINAADISDSLCSAMVNNGGNIKSIEDVKKFIAGYKNDNGGNNKSSSSSGTGTKNKNSLINSTSIANIPVLLKENTNIFHDIDNVPWAKDAIIQLYYKGIINGKTPELFAPLDTIKREEFAKMICLAFNMNLVGEDFPFTDVSKDDWAYKYVKTAYLAGITNGIGDKVFGKGLDISRQDLCVMVHRALLAANMEITGTVDIKFTDEGSISDYAKEAVHILASAGIINGDQNGCMNPSASATRAEVAKIIHKVMELFND